MSSGNNYRWSLSDVSDRNTAKYQAVRSPTKFLVLDLVDSRQELTYAQLADETGMPKMYAADRLVKYAHKGLLSRDREGKGFLSTFTLTPHGAERLAYFRNQVR